MLSKVNEIYSGWKNHLFPSEKLKDIIKEVSEERLAICTPCEFNSTPGKIKMFSKCNSCGCPLQQKSKSLQSKCPVDKWGPVATQEMDYEIKQAINGKKDSQKSASVEASDSD